jgi:hypothetical protein
MKKIALFSMALLLTGALGIVLLSSFKGGSVEEEKFTMTYFKFDEGIDPTEGNLEHVDSWEVEYDAPEFNPCNEGTYAPCIIVVPNSATGITGLDSDEQKKQKLVSYLASQSSAESFVDDDQVAIFRRS